MELYDIYIVPLKNAVYDLHKKNGSMMCGQIAGMIKEIRPCKEIIETIVSDAQKALENTDISL